ncbi:hypothetical protein P3T27_007556 [Kitasatospora sp. MAA19]|uniref:hypothetical protein n=1 Tax=unclassified Kitasatospora TaxID=2633591 RepID=UPI0024755B24|nr:hypothetical protein [Kitasatospora sp. MAA19]MDH6710805.1 hypothetical protein [Kitasatospora sp. MAA19]
MRPIYLPDEHLPSSAAGWTCRTCQTPWPCDTAQPYIQSGTCQCGAPTYHDLKLPRRWHIGPICYTHTDQLAALAEELHAYHQANPNYPPSHYYPPKPRRRTSPRPHHPSHIPTGPGDIRPGASLWVRPGGLHPGWGDIHRLAVLTTPALPTSGIWLHGDSTLHQVRSEMLLIDGTTRAAASAIGRSEASLYTTSRPHRLLPDWEWLGWTVADHLRYRQQNAPVYAQAPSPVQDPLFAPEPE